MTPEEWADEIMKKYYSEHYYPFEDRWYDFIEDTDMYHKSGIKTIASFQLNLPKNKKTNNAPISSGELKNSVPKGTAYFRTKIHYFDINGNELHLEGD